MRSFLRTVNGQIALIGATFLGAVVLAVVMAFNLGFFEGYVREKYPEPKGPTLFSGDDLADHYHNWMLDRDVSEQFPSSVVGADPEYFRGRIERTLAAGSREQKLRAVLFARLSGDRGCVPLLRWGGRRARAVGDEELARRLDEAVAALSR